MSDHQTSKRSRTPIHQKEKEKKPMASVESKTEQQQPQVMHFWVLEIGTDSGSFKLYTCASSAAHARRRLKRSLFPNKHRDETQKKLPETAFLSGETGTKNLFTKTTENYYVRVKKEDLEEEFYTVPFKTLEEAVSKGWLSFDKGSTILVKE